MKKHCFIYLIVLNFLMFSCSAFAQPNPSLKIIKTFPIKSNNWWDYIAVSPVTDYLYVSHGTQVNILDKNTGDSVGVIPNTKGVHGIAFAPEFNKGFTSNGGLNTVTVFDIKTNKVLDSIKTGENPDAIMYDPFLKKIITCNGRSKNLSVIDPAADSVVATISLSGKPETAVSDGAGKIYVNIEDKSEISCINIQTNTVEASWSIAPGESPSGLAINKKTRRLFAGCDNKLLMIINADNGNVVTKLSIGDGCDGVAFDSTRNLIFSSNGDGTLTMIQEQSGNNYKVLDNIVTKRGARTCTVDQQTHQIFLPTAELDQLNEGQRPKMKPGTFQVLVVGEK
ncbi:MAG: YncE family protein [Chitinophagaceae bacterium]